MKNRRNIVELKYPPENPNDIWLKDGKFYRSTSEGWIVIDSKTEYTSKESMIADNPKGGTIGIDKETGEASIYNDVAEQWSPLSGGGVTSITWQELKDKRDNRQLIPGALYRITDYQCTTTQENTQSAGHQFDIVLLALNENKLAEEGWAMEHPTDVYDVTFGDGVTKKCYLYCTNIEYNSWNIVDVDTLMGLSNIDANNECTINEDTKTVIIAEGVYDSTDLVEENLPYNYFQNSNLSAWKVWYCLDNDKSRFAWADDKRLKINVNGDVYITTGRDSVSDMGEYLYWGYQSEDVTAAVYTKGTPKIGDSVYTWTGSPSSPIWRTLGIVEEIEITNGRGIIYRLIDEFNNDIKYDFKNIQFKRKITDGQYDATNGSETWCYTLNIWYNDMCQDASIVGNTLPNDEGFVNGVYDNIFGYATAYDFLIKGMDTFAFALGNNVVLSFVDEDGYFGIFSNKIGDDFKNNTFGNYFSSNTIGNYCQSNIHNRNQFNGNMIGNDFIGNKINTFFSYNIIANSFVRNTINKNFESNIVGNSFNNKTISDNISSKNYGNNGVELATKNDIGNIETALSNI